MKSGEPRRNRTFNPQIKSLLLCQLSYRPRVGRTYTSGITDADGNVQV